MHEMEVIRLEEITLDHTPINPATLRLAVHLSNGGTVPPITVERKKSGGYRIKDGRHRVVAAKLIGNRYINAIVSERTCYPRGKSLNE